jgi:hypothetical protein
MSAELFVPDDMEEVTTSCAVCKKPMRVQVPKDPEVRRMLNMIEPADDKRGQVVFAGKSFMQGVAHQNCIATEIGRREAVRAKQDLNERFELWQKICPDEFKQAIDFQRCARELYNLVMAWTYSGRGIIASGRTGRCKTRFLFKLCEREFFAGRSVEYVRHPDFREKVSRLAYDDATKLYHYTKKFLTADIVFFDDLGKGRITAASEEAIESLINARTIAGLPIFFTTNDGDESLQARLSEDRGEPMLRRILDFCEPIDFGFV